jgi:long-chain fatty acid transport protein
MSRHRHRLAVVAVLACAALLPSAAHAGGLEMPDMGTEALGRGGAFTAKADDPTAVHYNVAGLAQQRGTRLLFNANVSKSSLRFERAGSYPDDPANPATPWGGKRYPAVDNQGAPLVLPFVAATSDLGLSWMTIALAVHPPPVAANTGKKYPLFVKGSPSPVRYDTVGGTRSVILFYTGALAFHLGDAVDIGVAVHAVQASLETRTVSYLDLAKGCENAEYQACDGRAHGVSQAWTATGSIGALARLGADVTAGLHVRGPVLFETSGASETTAPRALGGATSPSTGVQIRTALPLIVRGGIRKAFMTAAPNTPARVREVADIELDATYERWADAQSPGPLARLEKLGTTNDATITIVHNYKDTFSARLGGAYNILAGSVPLTLRAGAFYDGSATESADTRVDADTLAKVAGTLGVAAKLGAFSFNVAYAGVFDVPRNVDDGRLRPINAARGGTTLGADGNPLPVVNNGAYSGLTHVLSMGVVVELDEVLGFGRGGPPAAARSPAQGQSAPGTRL